MVFLGGPRQVGKTTLARDIVGRRWPSAFFSWDKLAQRKAALRGEWPADARLIVLDEFHKQPKWKTWLKGEHDTAEGGRVFLLTGSARMNVYRRGGDSLQGRYHYRTLHPFSLAESRGSVVARAKPGAALGLGERDPGAAEELESLLRLGGFPEPLLRGEVRFHRRWQAERMERFFREDVRDLTRITELGSLALLADLLPGRVASILSINSLAGDLGVNFRTVAGWLAAFELLYHSFRLPPFQTRRVSAVRKERKLYLWDWSAVEVEGPRFENLVASHLLRFCDFLHEHEGWRVELWYLRDTNGREVDFLVTNQGRPWFAVEAKLGDPEVSRTLLYFRERIGIPFCYQVTRDEGADFEKSGVRVVPASRFLAGLG
ncbi:MAG: ATP-binding protein [Deltaproteobacteria bacterium]|nr:ATP-binding protein [Deltaproteobacteria bacterium]